MPRQARLDTPGALHHVMARGIERGALFRENDDREDFLSRLGALVEKRMLVVYAWALMANHVHLLVRSTKTPLSWAMRSLMTGYAGSFNRRHGRVGHLFQNRFKSVLCEEEPYFLELVRYIHLNPLRAKVVEAMGGLRKSPLTGHSVLMGEISRAWQETGDVLGRYSNREGEARRRYEGFVEDGLRKPVPDCLEGGGLVRSAGGWSAVLEMRRGREGYQSDERVLGGSGFVKTVLKKAEKEAGDGVGMGARWELEKLVKLVCEHVGVDESALAGGGKGRMASRAREGISYLWVKWMGRSGGELSRKTGMKPITVYHAADRGNNHAREWREFLAGI